jgi:hypothetical protein
MTDGCDPGSDVTELRGQPTAHHARRISGRNCRVRTARETTYVAFGGLFTLA